jgi:dihydrofolate reductase
MGNVIVGLSMSLDGFIAGPNDGPGNPLGDGGGALFEWMHVNPEAYGSERFLNPPESSQVVVDEWYADSGAIVSGRRTWEIANGWGGRHPLGVPFFVLTHEPPDTDPGEGTFITDGIESALEQARAVAGDKKIAVCAADVAQQYLAAGLLDEIQVSLVPVLLGGGVRLFDHAKTGPIRLEQTRVIESDGVTHLDYRVVRPAT